MSMATGSPLQQIWKSSRDYPKAISSEQKAKIVSQLGSVTEQLSRLCFNRAGSLFECDGDFHIGTCLSRGLLLNKRYTLNDMARGPFDTEKDYYQAQLSAFVRQTQELPLDLHCLVAPTPATGEYHDRILHREAAQRWNDFVKVQSKINSVDNKVDYLIASEMLSNAITKWIDTEAASGSSPVDRFALHHPDLSVNNIYVDGNCNITCIIDWEFCSAVPLSLLLTAPGLPQSRDEIDPTLFHAYRDGFRRAVMETSEDDIGRESPLVMTLSCSRPVWLISRILNFDSDMDINLLSDLWEVEGHGRDIAEILRSKQLSEYYVALYGQSKRRDYNPLQAGGDERAYFLNQLLNETISRKLTMISEWSSRYGKARAHSIRSNSSKAFIADKRLWCWINKCVQKEAATLQEELGYRL
ncbi:MAG: hypothetical protein Q9207_005527 [Kuettlingeria erythrocarpa]